MVWSTGGACGRVSTPSTGAGRTGARIELEEEAAGGKVRKPVADAAKAFEQSRSIENSTAAKYTRILCRVVEFARAQGIETLETFQPGAPGRLPRHAQTERAELVERTTIAADVLLFLQEAEMVQRESGARHGDAA